MEQILRSFNGDVQTKEAFAQFVFDVINEEALEKMYRGLDVSHIKDAKELIEKAFDKLEDLYGLKHKQKEPTNQAK